jgi:hypothetical protein
LTAARSGDEARMAEATTTTDHETIRRWVEQHGGTPSHVTDTAANDDTGILRIDFGDQDEGLEPISWEEWFDAFEENGLAFLYQDEGDSRFNKLVSRETAGTT